MTDIHEQFGKAFSKIEAYAITKDGESVGRVVFKYPAAAGRLYCYLQVWGAEMARGFAGGYGYDKASAAFTAAAGRLPTPEERTGALPHTEAFRAVTDSGERWASQLRAAGYDVLAVI